MVNRSRTRCGVLSSIFTVRIDVNITMISIMASRQNSDISRWDSCSARDRVISANIIGINIIILLCIESRESNF